MLELSLKLLFAYLLGALSGSLIVGKLYGGVDIRAEGSGNAGGTNALRTHGSVFALWVVLIDVGKGMIAVLWLPGLVISGVGIDPTIARDWLIAGCGIAAVMGHVFPVWFEFRGGKGAATLFGIFVVLIPKIALAVAVVWVLIVLLTGYVGLATIIAAWTAPVAALLAPAATNAAILSFSVSMALFITFTHRENIARMSAGTENRMRRLMLFKS